MAKIIGFELKDEVIYLTSVIFSFLVASVIFFQFDLLYIISSYGFVLTAENTLSLLALLTIITSIVSFVVFMANIRLGTAYYQIYASLTIVVTSIMSLLYIVLWIMIFVYSSGRTLTGALWIIAEKVMMVTALAAVIYLHWTLKALVANKDSIFHEVGTTENDNNLIHQSFEIETKG